MDPIPELQSLLEFGVREAKDNDLLRGFGRLRSQLQEDHQELHIDWLGIYRSALKLADRIRPIRDGETVCVLLSAAQREQVDLELNRLLMCAQNICADFEKRLDADITSVLTDRLNSRIEDLELKLDQNMTSVDVRVNKKHRQLFHAWLTERISVFVKQNFESLELRLVESYQNNIDPIRRRVSQVGIRRPRLIRSPDFRFKPAALPRLVCSHVWDSEGKKHNLFSTRKRKREVRNELEGELRAEVLAYAETQLVEMRSEMSVNLIEFRTGVEAMLELWLSKTKNNLDNVTQNLETGDVRVRPISVGNILEAQIIPALMARIENLDA